MTMRRVTYASLLIGVLVAPFWGVGAGWLAALLAFTALSAVALVWNLWQLFTATD